MSLMYSISTTADRLLTAYLDRRLHSLTGLRRARVADFDTDLRAWVDDHADLLISDGTRRALARERRVAPRNAALRAMDVHDLLFVVRLFLDVDVRDTDRERRRVKLREVGGLVRWLDLEHEEQQYFSDQVVDVLRRIETERGSAPVR